MRRLLRAGARGPGPAELERGGDRRPPEVATKKEGESGRAAMIDVGTAGEVEIFAYKLLKEDGIARLVLKLMMRGSSTRNYEPVLWEMADTVGVSKSQVGRGWIEASAERLEVPSTLGRCLASTKINENGGGGVRFRTWRVMHWCEAALLEREEGFRRIIGYRNLWRLDPNLVVLGAEKQQSGTQMTKMRAA